MLVSQLTEDQRSHLMWRIDAKTGCGLGWARTVAGCLDGKDRDLVDVFIEAGRTPASAKIHARKVINFRLDPADKVAACMDFFMVFVRETRDLSPEDRVRAAEKLAEKLVEYAHDFNKTYARMGKNCGL